MTTIPLEVSPTSGDVGIQVADPDQPTIDVTPGKVGSGSEVAFTWYSVVSGEKYSLYSLPRERYMDKQDAGSSSVTLLDDDSEGSLVIRQVDGSTDGESTGGGEFSGGNWEDPTEGIQWQKIAVVIVWAALSIGLVAATGRSEIQGRRRWGLIASIPTGTGILALELLRPGVIVGAVTSLLHIELR
ncbi:hypothetical protein OB920_20660 [Halobacteria archaeon HArc-gm2]|nr:hypothetical protein [Halobacteria archaeon HArc-gm2]